MADRKTIKTYEEEKQEPYVQAIEPDRMKLKYYLNKAKGLGRTMSEFAKDCGVSPATFSRVMHEKNRRPLAPELIQSIIEHAENPDELPYRQVMKANGMVPLEKHESTDRNGHRDYEYEEREYTKIAKIKNIIEDEITARHLMHLFYDRLDHEIKIEKSENRLNIMSDFALRVEGYSDMFWNFLLITDEVSGKRNNNDGRYSKMAVNRTIGLNAEFFLRDAWEPESLEKVKQTFVVIDEEVFKEFEKKIKKIKVNSYISVLLIDINTERAVKEQQFERNDGKVMKSIFDEERIEEYGNPEEDQAGE
ncbi:MAG: hypothetical protein IKO61_03480 [Lachnospiraceae bacterium]|nr:hypothetical protein [Lachnospiraceae bacterium]